MQSYVVGVFFYVYNKKNLLPRINNATIYKLQAVGLEFSKIQGFLYHLCFRCVWEKK